MLGKTPKTLKQTCRSYGTIVLAKKLGEKDFLLFKSCQKSLT
jgi:hypothetical protein